MFNYTNELLEGNNTHIEVIAREKVLLCTQFLQSGIITKCTYELFNNYNYEFPIQYCDLSNDEIENFKIMLSPKIFDKFRNILFIKYLANTYTNDSKDFENIINQQWYDPTLILKCIKITYKSLIKLHEEYSIAICDIIYYLFTINNFFSAIQLYEKYEMNHPELHIQLIKKYNRYFLTYLAKYNKISDSQFAESVINAIFSGASCITDSAQIAEINLKWNLWNKIKKINIEEIIKVFSWYKSETHLERNLIIFNQICIKCKKVDYLHVRSFFMDCCLLDFEKLQINELEKVFINCDIFYADLFKKMCDNYIGTKNIVDIIKNAGSLDPNFAKEKFEDACNKGLVTMINEMLKLVKPCKTFLISIDTIDECFYNSIVNRNPQTVKILCRYANQCRNNNRIMNYIKEHNLCEFIKNITDVTFLITNDIIMKINYSISYLLETHDYKPYCKKIGIPFNIKMNDDDKTCQICTCIDNPENKCVIKFPCNHYSCIKCCNEWYIKGQNTLKCTHCTVPFSWHKCQYFHNSDVCLIDSVIKDKRKMPISISSQPIGAGPIVTRVSEYDIEYDEEPNEEYVQSIYDPDTSD